MHNNMEQNGNSSTSVSFSISWLLTVGLLAGPRSCCRLDAMFKSSVLLLLFFTAISGLGVQGRRSLLVQGVSASLAVLSGDQQGANPILSAKYCASGVGEGCQDLSEGNELIKSLQEKSAANKEANRKVCLLGSKPYCFRLIAN